MEAIEQDDILSLPHPEAVKSRRSWSPRVRGRGGCVAAILAPIQVILIWSYNGTARMVSGCERS